MTPEELAGKLRSILGELIIDVKVHKGNDYIEITVPSDKVIDAAKRLKSAGFDHIHDLTVVDYPKEGKFRLIYNLGSYSDPELSYYIVGLAYEIPRSNPVTITLYDVYTTADFQEREAYEGFGIIFQGHPDLKPLLLAPTVAELKPLRKDFIVREEPEILPQPPKRGGK